MKTQTTELDQAPAGLGLPSVETSVRELRTVLTALCRVVPKRTNIPILANVLIRAGGGIATVTGTDMDTTVTHPLDGRCDGNWTITANARELLAIATELSGMDSPVRLTPGANALGISCGEFEAQLGTLDPEDFPPGMPFEAAWSADVDAAQFATGLTRVQHAISHQETRYYLNGIHLANRPSAGPDEAGPWRFVATDGHRLALTETIESPRPLPKGLIMPRRLVAEMTRLLAGVAPSARLTIFLNEGASIIKFGISEAESLGMKAWSVTAKLIDGTFPDYERVIPRQLLYDPKAAQIDRRQFRAVARRVAAVSSEYSRPVRVDLSLNRLSVSSVNVSGGKARQTMSATHGFANGHFGVNAKYLGTILDACEGETVTLGYSSPADPLVWLDADPAGERADLVQVLMPLRV